MQLGNIRNDFVGRVQGMISGFLLIPTNNSIVNIFFLIGRSNLSLERIQDTGKSVHHVTLEKMSLQ